MFGRIFFIALTVAPAFSSAACSATFRSPDQTVVISDNGCEFSEEMIFVRTRASERNLVEQPPISFTSQCVWNVSGRDAKQPAGFHCTSNGATVLAGTTYKEAPGKKKVCGDSRWPIYKCMKGCTRHNVPLYFEIEPYEC